MRWAALLFILGMLGLSGCAVQTRALLGQPPSELGPSHELRGTPFFPQTTYQCGPAALATALGAVGFNADPSALAEQVFLPARTGTLQVEMIAGARRQGAVATRLPPTIEAVLRELRAGRAVVVLQNLGLSWVPRWHYAVLIGYDIAAAEVMLRSGATRREVMAMRTFEHTWARSGHWAFVALPPGQWPVTAQEREVVDASVGFERVAAPQQAVTVYRSALERFGGNLSLAMGLGNSLHAAGDPRGAADAFRHAAQQHHSAPAWINLASTLLELGEAQSALSAAREAVALGDSRWQAQAEAVQTQAQALVASNAPPHAR
jgi:tetratricopeptide (TPR) repeat protein